jgi:hypothetical protein
MARKLSSICHVADPTIIYSTYIWWGLKQMTDTLFSKTILNGTMVLERDDDAPKLPTWFDKPEPRSYQPKMKLRTVWISDVHLGTAGCIRLNATRCIWSETLSMAGGFVKVGIGLTNIMRLSGAS